MCAIKKISFESEEEIAWTLDGEYGGDHKKVEIENLQKAVKIIIPESHIADVSEEGLKAKKENKKSARPDLVSGYFQSVRMRKKCLWNRKMMKMNQIRPKKLLYIIFK